MLMVPAFASPISAQDNRAWRPSGNERWIFQSEQTSLLPTGLVRDSDRDQAIVPDLVVIPLFSTDPEVKPLSSETVADFHHRGIRMRPTATASLLR